MSTADEDRDQPDPQHDAVPVLDYAQPRKGVLRETVDLGVLLTRGFFVLVALAAIPFGYGGVFLICRWAAGTDNTDVGEGLCFLFVGAFLLILPVLGWRATSR
jgi:hypothetical protein